MVGHAQLAVSILTSSSPLPLEKLVAVVEQDPVEALEIYVFRSIDIRRFVEKGILSSEMAQYDQLHQTDSVSLVANLTSQHLDAIREYIGGVLKGSAKAGRQLRVTGMATFFPEITSADPNRRALAVKALINVATLASALGASCVELVGGTRLDGCCCGKFSPGGPCRRIECRSPSDKLRWLAEGLTQVMSSPEASGVCFALEMETDRYSVINEEQGIATLRDTLGGQYRDRLGLNLDIAHMLMNGITKERLTQAGLHKRIANAHISDTAGAHLQDLVPGTFHRLVSPRAADDQPPETDVQGLAALLWDRAREPGDTPFSGSISVELEFCSWVDWLRTAVRKTRFLLDSTRPDAL